MFFPWLWTKLKTLTLEECSNKFFYLCASLRWSKLKFITQFVFDLAYSERTVHLFLIEIINSNMRSKLNVSLQLTIRIQFYCERLLSGLRKPHISTMYTIQFSQYIIMAHCDNLQYIYSNLCINRKVISNYSEQRRSAASCWISIFFNIFNLLVKISHNVWLLY